MCIRDRDESVDYDALMRLVDYQLQNNTDFLCVLGTTAETPTLTEEEKMCIRDSPISINYVDRQRNEVWFLIQLIGDGTQRLGEAKAGDIINVVLPLGNCFTMPEKPSDLSLIHI